MGTAPDIAPHPAPQRWFSAENRGRAWRLLSARLLTICLACLFLTASARAEVEAEGPLRIGVLDYSGAEHSLTDWNPTLAALRQALPERRVEIRAFDIHGLEAAVAGGAVEFIITNPGNYAELEYRYHISRIATAQEDLPIASTLVSTGDFRDFDALAGKRVAVVATEAFGGFQVIWREMSVAARGLPERVEWVVTGYPMPAAARAVLDGRADAAVLKACLLEELQAADPQTYGPLRAVLSEIDPASGCAVSSRVYPGWPFARMPQVPADLGKRVAVALMEMQAENLWTVPVDYQPVHDLLRELRIGPYARTGPVNLREFVRDYRDWLIGIAVALVFWAIHSVRTEKLVRRRTRALNEANADLTREMAERRRAEEADRLHRRELEHVARLSILGEMASSIAHKLNQPLSAISSYAEGCAMRLRAGRLDAPAMEQAAGEISAQAERAALVIKRIRAFVRKRETRPVTVDIHDLVRDCATIFEATTRRAGVRVGISLAPGLPVLRADRVQLQQVVLNMVQNAVDAMAETEPAERRLVLEAVPQQGATGGAGLCLSVRDHGSGMSDAAMDRFAEPFYTTKPEGIGLGLALSRSIVEAHGGVLGAERPGEGRGLRVMIWLPAGEAQ